MIFLLKNEEISDFLIKKEEISDFLIKKRRNEWFSY